MKKPVLIGVSLLLAAVCLAMKKTDL